MSANLGLMFLIINNAGIMINVGANETVEEVELAKITLSKNENKYKCNSCTLYIVLFSILFPINVGIGTYFIYFNWYLRNNVTRVEFDTSAQTTIY